MRLVIQGNLTPTQLGNVVKEMVENTLSKVEDVEAKRHVLHNPVIEFNLNLKGFEEPQLLVDEEREGVMLQLRTGFKDGKFTEYEEVDRTELIDKFYRMVDNAEAEVEKENPKA